MSPDPGPAPDPPDRRWTLVHQGAFVRGRCDACGYVSPARRARATVESDLEAHEVLSQASEELGPASVAVTGSDAASADAHEEA